MLVSAQQFVEEYRAILGAAERALGADGEMAGEDGRCPAPVKELMLALVELTEHMQRQVSAGQLQVDLVLAAVLGEACARMTELVGRAAAGGPFAGPVARDARMLQASAAEVFAHACRRTLVAPPRVPK